MAHTLPSRPEVLIVGAGLSGLSCAKILSSAGVDVHVLEASDGVGGRIRTDESGGFLLDRGFQVILTAYEELQAQLDTAALNLRAFRPGTLVWNGKRMVHLSDPWREPASALSAMRAPIGRFKDKLAVGALRSRLLSQTPGECFEGEERSTQAELEHMGFSATFIDTFFRPFLGGVFLERALETSSHLFRYYFRCFSAGEAAIPRAGMQRLPEQLAEALPDRITLDAEVGGVSATGVTLRDGRKVDAGRVVLAVDGTGAAELVGHPAPSFKSTVTSYFAAAEPPTNLPLLILDGEGTGPANHVAVLSNVSPDYAPEGAHLVSVSGVDKAAQDPDGFREAVPRQLRRWFGGTVDGWEHLKTYRIPHALPRHPAGSLKLSSDPLVLPDGLILAGDYTEFGAIQGALLSGRRAAEAILGGS
jgi:phytoene dehydrogenase-like protein